jgi:hypothetical protein
MRWLVIVGGLGVIVYTLHRLAKYAAGRGWIYYRDAPKRGYSLGFVEEVFQPSMEFVIEEQSSEAIRADAWESAEGAPGADGYRVGDGSG